jgi:hypothetical protein
MGAVNGFAASVPIQGREMAARAGIEPFICFLEACAEALRSETTKTPNAQLRAQELSSLTKILAAWPKLSGEFRTAVLMMTRSAAGGQ